MTTQTQSSTLITPSTPSKLSSDEKSLTLQHDGVEIIVSVLATIVIAAAIYLLPDFLLLENLYRDIVLVILQTIGINATATPPELMNIPDPALNIPGYSIPCSIVRLCTAMQAGAIILALIVVTKAPLRKKIIAGSTFCVILFFANILRLIFHFVLIYWGFPFWFAHDFLSKPIGFVGTIIFSLIIEKQGVPLIETFADWMEFAGHYISALLKKIGL
ncbi:MAG: heimdallarchaeosortase [Promethearchaeota archaeon]